MRTSVTKGGRGWRLEQHGCVVSEVLAEPGPTHSVFDVLAASVRVFAPGPRLAMLGFAGGGMVAPLRRLGGAHCIEGVDLSREGYELYRSVAKGWGGEVRFFREDAVRWLQKQRRKFDVIVEDLSVPTEDDVVKPEVSWKKLPELIGRKLGKRGVGIANLLPTPGISWEKLITACRTGPGVVVEFEGFYNRVLIQGPEVGTAKEAGRRIRSALRELGSDLAEEIRMRALPE